MSTSDHTTEPFRIPLTQGKFALVNPEDFDLTQFKWCANNPNKGAIWYAVRGIWNPVEGKTAADKYQRCGIIISTALMNG